MLRADKLPFEVLEKFISLIHYTDYCKFLEICCVETVFPGKERAMAELTNPFYGISVIKFYSAFRHRQQLCKIKILVLFKLRNSLKLVCPFDLRTF